MGRRSVCSIVLSASAVLAVVGGVGACAYNGRMYDKMKNYTKQFESSFTLSLNCALSSAIFGIFRAIVSITAFALLIVGLRRVVSILLIVSAVLYLGEMITEALLLDAIKYGLSERGLYLWPVGMYQCASNSKLTEWITKYEQWTATIPHDDGNWTTFTGFFENVDAYWTGYCWEWDYGTSNWRAEYANGSCLLDFTKTKFPDFNT